MLLGEHEHALDEKNRLTLPSKLRGAFGDGVVVTRGLDGCLYAWPVEAWEAMAERLEAVDPFSVDGRRIRRHFFSGAAHGELDKQGRLVIRRRCSKRPGSRAR